MAPLLSNFISSKAVDYSSQSKNIRVQTYCRYLQLVVLNSLASNRVVHTIAQLTVLVHVQG
jgi:hypothetical protein